MTPRCPRCPTTSGTCPTTTSGDLHVSSLYLIEAGWRTLLPDVVCMRCSWMCDSESIVEAG